MSGRWNFDNDRPGLEAQSFTTHATPRIRKPGKIEIVDGTEVRVLPPGLGPRIGIHNVRGTSGEVHLPGDVAGGNVVKRKPNVNNP